MIPITFVTLLISGVLAYMPNVFAQPTTEVLEDKTKVIAENVDSVVFNPYVKITMNVSNPATALSPGMQKTFTTSISPQNPAGVTEARCNDGSCDGSDSNETVDTCPADCGNAGCGELTGDGQIDLWDLTVLVNVAFKGGSLPSFINNAENRWRADIAGDGVGPDIVDVVRMVNHVIRGYPDQLNCLVP